jgi:hypothetical protein
MPFSSLRSSIADRRPYRLHRVRDGRLCRARHKFPYAECSIMRSTRLVASIRLVNRAISCARLGIIEGLSRIIQELFRLAILAMGENNNAFPIRERC